jgi:hypothetical protein
MSEYQHYEFQAIDRPLSKAEMAAVRALSTRATITSTRFQNEYHWGDFKGDPLTLMERYYDAHLYFANWGTRILMLRLPVQLLDADTALRYCFSDGAEVHTKGDNIILDFRSENEEGEDWEEGPEGWPGDLIPLRADLLGGDLRALYISWLSCAEAGLLDDDDSEPPVPAGLGSLTASLKALAGFLRVSDDLLAVAAERSAPRRESRAASGDLARWVAALPVAEKDALVVRVLDGDALYLRAELLRRFRIAQAAASPAAAPAATGRTVGELIAEAEGRTAARRREQARREAETRGCGGARGLPGRPGAAPGGDLAANRGLAGVQAREGIRPGDAVIDRLARRKHAHEDHRCLRRAAALAAPAPCEEAELHRTARQGEAAALN